MDLLQYLKPEMAVLIPILCFWCNLLRRQGCKRHADVFFIVFALTLSTGYVLTTSRLEDCGDFWQAAWLGVGQGFACLAACSLSCGRETDRRRTQGIQHGTRPEAVKNAQKNSLKKQRGQEGKSHPALKTRNKKPRYPRG
jgi:hypothetical protein